MCCLFGIFDFEHRLDNKTLSYITSALSVECQARGTDATGIAYLHNGNLSIYKRPVAAYKLKIRLPNDCHAVMGHTRLTTQGSERKNRNNHPFIGYANKTPFALAHNGVLRNYKKLRTSEKLPYTDIETDSYIAVQLIEKQKALDFASLRYVAEKIEGSFSFTALDKRNNLYFIKGDNPLCIYKFGSLGFYIYASTKEILKNALVRLKLQDYEHEEVKIKGGDILRIDSNGQQSYEQFEFDEYETWGYSFKAHRRFYNKIFDAEYWEELKSIASAFGYSKDDIDLLEAEGYSPEDVECILYCGETETKEKTDLTLF